VAAIAVPEIVFPVVAGEAVVHHIRHRRDKTKAATNGDQRAPDNPDHARIYREIAAEFNPPAADGAEPAEVVQPPELPAITRRTTTIVERDRAIAPKRPYPDLEPDPEPAHDDDRPQTTSRNRRWNYRHRRGLDAQTRRQVSGRTINKNILQFRTPTGTHTGTVARTT
jgi:hypothetical protein